MECRVIWVMANTNDYVEKLKGLDNDDYVGFNLPKETKDWVAEIGNTQERKLAGQLRHIVYEWLEFKIDNKLRENEMLEKFGLSSQEKAEG